MLIYDFLKKLFGWADDAPRKRRAVSFSLEKEFVKPKKQCCDYKQMTEEELFENKDDSDDDIEVISEHKYFPVKSSSKLNGTCSSRDKSFTCCTPPFSTPKPCRDTSNMGYFVNKSERVKNIGVHQQCSMLTKTHRLKEKIQYEELLRNFFSHRIHVICDKHEDKRSTQDSIEVIDLEKPSASPLSSKTPPASRKHDTTLKMLYQKVCSTSQKEKKGKEVIITLDSDKREDTVHSIHDKKQSSTKSVNVEKSMKKKYIDCVITNTLRDQLAAKDVIREDYVPQVAKRYNERIEQRYREAEELKRMTSVLSKHNRLAREAALEEYLAQSMRLCEAVLDEREDLEERELPTLTEEMLQELKNALIPRPPNEVLVEEFGLRITRKDLHTLADLNWLNDEVINFYMNLLIARSSNKKYPKVHAMNTFFYPKLISGGHSSLKRWTRKIDIFAQNLIVVPVHLGIHWCMSIIDFRDRSIRYYDSMGGNNPKCLSALQQYLEDESLDKKKQVYDTSNWKLECAKNIPQQMNGSDCGVFSCMFAEYICANKKITFTQQDMPYFRNKMAYEILKSKLL
ncbi:Sentrin-specific protease 1 [Anthophora quadrimaculata]